MFNNTKRNVTDQSCYAVVEVIEEFMPMVEMHITDTVTMTSIQLDNRLV